MPTTVVLFEVKSRNFLEPLIQSHKIGIFEASCSFQTAYDVCNAVPHLFEDSMISAVRKGDKEALEFYHKWNKEVSLDSVFCHSQEITYDKHYLQAMPWNREVRLILQRFFSTFLH